MATRARAARTRTSEDDLRPAVTCGNGCRGNLVSVTMTVRGEPITMVSCSSCDHRTWNRRGERVELRTLLEDIRLERQLRKAG